MFRDTYYIISFGVKPGSNRKAVFLILFIITSNFGAEDERSYFQLRLEPENVLNMFLKLCAILFH